jgi:hypothetical protein
MASPSAARYSIGNDHNPPGFEMVVDYADNQEVKRIELPGAALDQSGRRRSVSVRFSEHHQSSSTS